MVRSRYQQVVVVIDGGAYRHGAQPTSVNQHSTMAIGVGSEGMSVEITAGSPDVDDDATPEIDEAVAAAQSVLSGRFGAQIRLADPEDLGGAGQSVVIR